MKHTQSIIILLAVFFGMTVFALADDIKDIRVRNTGAGPLEEESVLAFTTLKAGEPFAQASVSRDVKMLQASGRFSDVQVEVERTSGGLVVTYAVNPRLRIHRIAVEGADYIGNRKALDLLEIGPGDLVDDMLLGARAQLLRDHYAKRYFPEVNLTWTITPAEKPDTVMWRSG